jgi:hypothetical protein
VIRKSDGIKAKNELTHRLLFGGIEDAEGTIHANDAKCSAALITHGLLFAGVVTVTAKAAEIYPDAHGALPIIALVLGGLTGAAFLVSIIALLLAVMPYRPKALMSAVAELDPPPPRLFFPPPLEDPNGIGSGAENPVFRQLRAAQRLDEQAVTLELVAESVKLAAVRDHEVHFARIGYGWLIAEVVMAVAYLSVVAVVAMTAV